MIKKNILLLVTVVSMGLTLTACTIPGLKPEMINHVAEEEEEVKVAEPEPVAETEPEDEEEEKLTLESFFAKPENQLIAKAFTIVPEGYKDTVDKVEVSFKENRMIYSYYYKANLGDAQAAIEENANSMSVNLFAEIRKIVDTPDPIEIEMIYYNNDGTVAADVVLTEDPDKEYKQYTSDAEEGTVEYFYETMYGPDYWQKAADQTLAANPNEFSDVKCVCSGNTVTYTYTCKTNLGNIQEQLDATFSESDQTMVISTIKTPAGVKDTVTVIYIYLNPDGTTAGKIEYKV